MNDFPQDHRGASAEKRLGHAATVPHARYRSGRELQAVVGVLTVTMLASAQVTERVSVDASGAQGTLGADLPFPGFFVSGDGQFAVFTSPSSNLVPGDANATWDIFVRDRENATTELASIAWTGSQANGPSGIYGICISIDGRFVVFHSDASNLVPGDTNGFGELFVRDRLLATTERVGVSSAGAQGNSFSFYPSISDDGRFVAFESPATNLVSGDTNGFWDVLLRDRVNGTTECVSVGVGGSQSNGDSGGGSSLSSDGRYVCFASNASNLVTQDSNGSTDVFVFDTQTGLTELVSVDSFGVAGNSWSMEASISGNGRFVTFTSNATNLVPGDTNAAHEIFVHDRLTHITERANISTNGTQGNGLAQSSKISADGLCVSFTGASSNLVAGDTTNAADIFVRDRRHGTTERVSVATSGAQANANCEMPSISADGRYVVFRSAATTLVPGDTNAYEDVFIHDRHATGFTSLCDPGGNNVLPCPCANPPSAPGRGCDNSSSTGGATLAASGIAYLSIDSLVFTTTDERPTATSILLQGNASIPTGLAFGQGVRCAGGTLKRLYVKSALGGSISAPNFGAGDPSVSARSAQLGSPIQAGLPYFYVVYYRDPVVLGGCPATSTFNATQTGSISWWP